MDWFRGQNHGKTPYFIRKSMVSGQDFPLNQSIESIEYDILQLDSHDNDNTSNISSNMDKGSHTRRSLVFTLAGIAHVLDMH